MSQLQIHQYLYLQIEEWKISAPVVTVPPLSESGSRKDSMPSFNLPPTPTVMGDDQAATETIQFCDQVKEQVSIWLNILSYYCISTNGIDMN